MKSGVLALDYDGTIATNGVLDEGVRSAIEDLRAKGITVVLVTGRILKDLGALMGDLWRVIFGISKNQYRMGQLRTSTDALIQAIQDRYRLSRNHDEIGVRDLSKQPRSLREFERSRR